MPGAESSSEKVASGSGGGSAANGPSSSTTTPSHMQSQGTGGGGSGGGAGGAGAANAEYRVVVFGAAGVGKTSLVLRFVRGTFRETYVPTIEDTYRQVISCNKQVCTLQITDTTGTHQFPAMQRLSMSKGHAFLLVYSIASRQSLEELRPIVTELVSVRGGQAALAEVPLMLVGNKCDENNNREVSVAEGQQHAKKWGCAFMETSAKTNLNVKEMFQELLQLEKRRNVSLAPAAGLDGKEGKKRKGGAATGDQPDGTKSGGGCLVM